MRPALLRFLRKFESRRTDAACFAPRAATTSLSLLPTPRFAPPSSSSSSGPLPTPAAPSPGPSASSTALTTTAVPPYGHRSGFRPASQADFGDGGAYPECPIAQYPLELGRKKAATNGKTLALQVDQEGNVDYAVIARQGQREGKNVQSSFKGASLLSPSPLPPPPPRATHPPSLLGRILTLLPCPCFAFSPF